MRRSFAALAVLLALPLAPLAAQEPHATGAADTHPRLVVFEDFSSPT